MSDFGLTMNGSELLNWIELRFAFYNESARWEPQQAGTPHPHPTSQQHYRKLVSAGGVCKVCSSDD